jgi:hypothetical protein
VRVKKLNPFDAKLRFADRFTSLEGIILEPVEKS